MFECLCLFMQLKKGPSSDEGHDATSHHAGCCIPGVSNVRNDEAVDLEKNGAGRQEHPAVVSLFLCFVMLFAILLYKFSNIVASCLLQGFIFSESVPFTECPDHEEEVAQPVPLCAVSASGEPIDIMWWLNT
jgi:hypothetical protein